MALVVANRGPDPVTVSFRTGQRFDFAIWTPEGEEAWRWSEGRMFTQALGEERVAPGDSLAYRATFEGELSAGSYRLVGSLTASNRSLSDTTAFRVEE